jgi:hypothetical protein
VMMCHIQDSEGRGGERSHGWPMVREEEGTSQEDKVSANWNTVEVSFISRRAEQLFREPRERGRAPTPVLETRTPPCDKAPGDYQGRLSRSEFHEGQVPLKARGSCSWCWYS